MSNIFFIGDTHFGHSAICKFTRDDGSKLRPWDDINEHDEALIENWNRVVGIHDKVYHLGDVAMRRESIKELDRCNGNKVLVRGNHDKYKLKDYAAVFKDIRGTHIFHDSLSGFGAWLSHIPMHPKSVVTAHVKYNVHGHTHHRIVHKYEQGLETEIDTRYICVSCEQVNYTPIALEDLIVLARSRNNE